MENYMDSQAENLLPIESEGIRHLSETRKWTFFISVVGFVFIGMMFIVLLMVMAGTATREVMIPRISILPILLMIPIYLIPIWYLFQFSRYSRLAIGQNSTTHLTLALKNLKLHYRFMGVLMAIILGLYVVFFIGVLIGRIFA